MQTVGPLCKAQRNVPAQMTSYTVQITESPDRWSSEDIPGARVFRQRQTYFIHGKEENQLDATITVYW
jgi:hypothetical protein